MDNKMITIFKDHRLRQPRNNDENRVLRARTYNEQRRQTRNDIFAAHRDLGLVNGGDKESQEVQLEQETKTTDQKRLERLKKWKAQKEETKLRLALKKKPPFKVGVVSHSIGSPFFGDASTFWNKKCVTKVPQSDLGRPNTRSNTHRIQPVQTKLNVALPSRLKVREPLQPKKQVGLSLKPTNLKSRGNMAPATTQHNMALVSADASPRRNLRLRKVNLSDDAMPTPSAITDAKRPDNHVAPNSSEVPNIAMGSSDTFAIGDSITLGSCKPIPTAKRRGELPVETTTDKVNDKACVTLERGQIYPAQFSPFVSNVRGKEGGASYTRAQYSQAGYTSPNQAEVDLSVQYFRNTLKGEITRLEAECERWLEVQTGGASLPEFVMDLLDLAVGQTRLLITKKLEQFRGLVDKCEFGCEGTVVFPTDLQGFWDMVYIQIVNVDVKFEELAKLQSNNWIEEERVVKKVAVKKRAAAKKPVQASSMMKTMLEAARRKKAELAKTELQACTTPPRSPRLSILGLAVNRSSQRNDLLHQALSADGKRRAASVAEQILSASKMAKIVEMPVDKVDLPLLNLNVTPNRSIMKRESIASRVVSNRRSTANRTSCRRVQFRDDAR